MRRRNHVALPAPTMVECDRCNGTGAVLGTLSGQYITCGCCGGSGGVPKKSNVHTCAPYGRTDGRCGECGEVMP